MVATNHGLDAPTWKPVESTSGLADVLEDHEA